MGGSDERIEVEGCDTIPKLFWHQVKARDDRTAFREKDLGIWRRDLVAPLRRSARAGRHGPGQLGLQRGEVVSVLAETVPEWLYVDMGTMGAGGVSNGIYPTDSAKQVDYILNDSRSRFLFVENEEQLDKFSRSASAARRSPRSSSSTWKVWAISTTRWSCRSTSSGTPPRTRKANPGLWEKLVAGSRAEELAMLVYTSGTTGPAKGAMLSHRNVIFQLSNADAFIPIDKDGEQLAFLPLCHVAERTFTAFLPLRSGAIANFAESAETVPDNIREVAPPPSLPCRASGSVSLRHRHPHEGGDLDRPAASSGRSGSGSKWRKRSSTGASPWPSDTGGCTPSPTAWCWTTSSAPSACTT